jgi:histidyl-tRNA synthetase
MEIFIKLRGMRDILPEEVWKWQKVEKIFIEMCELFGYREIRVPILEYKNLFVRGIGSSTDIVMKEMYEFKDKKGREVALRPEGTASVVRAYIENQIYNREKISRFYYYGPMFRYDRPQKGRYREFYQFGVEVFGGKNPYFDGEVILLLNETLKKLEISGTTFLINSLGCKNCKVSYISELKNQLMKISDSLCSDCKIRIEKNPLRVFDCKNENCRLSFKNLPLIIDYLCEECRFHFKVLVDFLNRNNINYRITGSLVRGLDYYTKTVFEVISEKEDIAIAGGGRYDNLVNDMGGPDIPAVGFAVGIDRIIPLVKDDEKNEKVIYLILLGEKAKIKGIEIIKKFINKKINFETDYEDRKLSDYLRIASKKRRKWCIILGENEIDKGVIILKDMERGIQEEIKEEEIIEKIKEKLKC